MRFAKPKLRGGASAPYLRLGYVPTLDAVPIIAAFELQLFAQHGVSVTLERELGLGSLRERLIHEEIEIASTQANMAITTYVGLGSVRRHCVSGLIFGVSPRILILSRRLAERGIRTPAQLGEQWRAGNLGKRLLFGAVQEHSTHHHYLKGWLAESGLPQDAVEMVILPSTMLYESMRKGLLDAYCAAEPWSSLGSLEGLGEKADSVPGHSACLPDRALLVLREFAEKHHDEHVRVIAALIEASHWCSNPDNHDTLARWLSQEHYFDIPYAAMLTMLGWIDASRTPSPLRTLHRSDSAWGGFQLDLTEQGCPSRDRARLILSEVVHNLPPGPDGKIPTEVLGRIFREDVFHEANKIAQERIHGHGHGHSTGSTPPVMPGLDGASRASAKPSSHSLSAWYTNQAAPATHPHQTEIPHPQPA